MVSLASYDAVHLGDTEVAKAYHGAVEVWSPAAAAAEHVASTAATRTTANDTVTVSLPEGAETGDLLVVFWWRNHASDESVPAGWTHRGSVSMVAGDLRLHAATRVMEAGDTSWSWPLVLVGDTITAVRDGAFGAVNVASNSTSLSDAENGLAVIGSANHYTSGSADPFTPSDGTSTQTTMVGASSDWRNIVVTHKAGDITGLTLTASNGSAANPTGHIAVEIEPVGS